MIFQKLTFVIIVIKFCLNCIWSQKYCFFSWTINGLFQDVFLNLEKNFVKSKEKSFFFFSWKQNYLNKEMLERNILDDLISNILRKMFEFEFKPEWTLLFQVLFQNFFVHIQPSLITSGIRELQTKIPTFTNSSRGYHLVK